MYIFCVLSFIVMKQLIENLNMSDYYPAEDESQKYLVEF